MGDHFDALGRPVILGPELGAGGEGTVFALSGDERHVAKIYHNAISPEKADKLKAMVKLASPELSRFSAWPAGTVHAGRNGPMVGVVLPRVYEHRPIQNLYSPAHRRVDYPDKDWLFLLHVGLNCAAAFDSIHCRSHVIGDVNQGNLLVSAQGTVCFIDCDSFQICCDGRLFSCDVGVAHFVPPELQGQSLRGVHRTPNHDNFGLAVLLFHLLFLGRHPFAGCYAGADNMTIERAIQEFRFAFGRNSHAWQMAPPPDTLPIEQIAPPLAPLFERAFQRGSESPHGRPSAKQWWDALKTLRSQVRDCPADEGHRYAGMLKACPWCAIMERNGLNFFASVTLYRLTTSGLEVSAEMQHAASRILAIKPPHHVFPEAPRPVAPPRPTPLPPDLETTCIVRNIVRAIALMDMVLALITAPLKWPLYLTAPLLMVTVVFWIVLTRFTALREEKARRYLRRDAHRLELYRLQTEWRNMAFHYGWQFDDARIALVRTGEQAKGLKDAYGAEYAELERSKVDRQRARYLQGAILSDAQIDGVDQRLVTELGYYGIETAYDVDRQRLQRAGHFTQAEIDALAAWRRSTEKAFRYNPSKGVPEADRQALAQKFVRMRQDLEQALSGGAAELEDLAKDANRVLGDIERRYREELAAEVQADADYRAIR